VVYQNGQVSNSHYYVALIYGALPSTYPLTGAGYNNNQYVIRAPVSTVVNNTPAAVNDAYSTNEDTLLTAATSGVLANDNDADGNPLTAVLVAGVSHGSLVLNSNGSFTYTPSANFNGADSFTYMANDGLANSNTATVTITVNAVNDPPSAVNDTYSTKKNNGLTVAAPGVLANDSDADGNPLTSVLVAGVSHGSLTLNSNGSFTYTPVTGYTGSDSFTYMANDGLASSNTATVAITITEPVITFGLNNGNSTWNESQNYLNAMRFQNTAGTGRLTKLEIFFNDSTPNGNVRLGVYADNNGRPGTLLLDAGVVVVANGWVSITGLNLAVTQNTYYWLCFDLQSANVVVYQNGQVSNSHYYVALIYGALPSTYPLTGAGYNNNQYVIRATVSLG